jgi:hypothetical protein
MKAVPASCIGIVGVGMVGLALVALTLVAEARGQAPDQAALDQVLQTAASYIAHYEAAISAVVAQEDYQQVVQGAGVRGRSAPVARTTRADLLVLDIGRPGWVAFRDVYQVDGRPVRDHDERLSRLFADFTPDSMAQARRIADESARFNLNAGEFVINRTINTPMTALLFLRAANQSRSAFQFDKTERIGPVTCAVVRFTEQTAPRLIGTKDASPATGAFWIDPATGTVLRSELALRASLGPPGQSGQFLSAKLRVEFAEVAKLGLWLPAVMDETYEVRPGTQVIIGHAEYSDFRKFEVSTAVEVQ